MLENLDKAAIGEFTGEKATGLRVASVWIWPGRCEEEAHKPHETQANSCWATRICAPSRPVRRSGRMLVCFGVASDPNYLCDFTLELPWERELLVTFSSGEWSAQIFRWKLAQVRQDLLAQPPRWQHRTKVGSLQRAQSGPGPPVLEVLPLSHPHWFGTEVPWCNQTPKCL